MSYSPGTEREPLPSDDQAATLQGRRVVLTGGSSGLGLAMARELHRRGAEVVVGSRRPVPAPLVHRPLDLASRTSTRDFAHGLMRDGRPIDLLVLNAGVHVPWRTVRTGDGEELHWQVNYLSNFVLTHLLEPLCARSELRRLVYVASEAHRLASLPGARLLGFWRRYASSKEAAVTFFLSFARLHPELTVRVVSPGYVDTPIHGGKSRMAKRVERAWSHPRPSALVASEILRTALAPPVDGDGYWDRGRARAPSARCLDDGRIEALWRASVASVGDLVPSLQPLERIVNYAGNVRELGPAIQRPATLDALADVVRVASASGLPIRVVGKCHSYNDAFLSRGRMISVERLDRVVDFDPERGTVTAQGGITIGVLCRWLDERGYALRFSGNFGEQTLAGALATGTHGYGRDGGVMGELVRGMAIMLPDGSVHRTRDECELRALRLSLGTLGVVVELTMAVEPKGPCTYAVGCTPRVAFIARLEEHMRAHEYLRFVPHPFDARQILHVTIDRGGEGGPMEPARSIGDARAGLAGLLVGPLKVPAVRVALGRLLRVGGHGYTLRVPFSGMLFVGSGVVRRHASLARAGQRALDRPDWLNMELAVPVARYAELAETFEAGRPRRSALLPGHAYYTCRVVGAADNVALAPNHDRDVVFVDIHADPADPRSVPFLRGIEEHATTCVEARPHWGKMFFTAGEDLRALYPGQNVAEFLAAKRRFDPAGVFSNDYTRRVLGV